MLLSYPALRENALYGGNRAGPFPGSAKQLCTETDRHYTSSQWLTLKRYLPEMFSLKRQVRSSRTNLTSTDSQGWTCIAVYHAINTFMTSETIRDIRGTCEPYEKHCYELKAFVRRKGMFLLATYFPFAVLNIQRRASLLASGRM